MSDNVLIPLPNFTLPVDLPWRVHFIGAVNDQLRRMHATGHYAPPRFFGYYFQGGSPIGVSGSWTVSLDPIPLLARLPDELKRATQGSYSITTVARDSDPEFLLVHDRRDGACWLWKFAYGLRFVEATEASTGEDDCGHDSSENRRLLGP
jgi:hypothetical protein